jgi:hypothetical protein
MSQWGEIHGGRLRHVTGLLEGGVGQVSSPKSKRIQNGSRTCFVLWRSSIMILESLDNKEEEYETLAQIEV